MIGGIATNLGFKSTVCGTDIGIVETNLHPWQIDEATREFINQNGWSLLYDQNPHVGKVIRVASSPNGDKFTFECLQKRTRSGGVTIYISKNQDSGQKHLAQQFSEYLRTRFGQGIWRL